MVAISSQYSFGADKAVQISQAVFFDKGTQPKPRHAKLQNHLINLDIRSSLLMALLDSNFKKISTLLFFLCTRDRFFCLEVLTF